MVSNLCRLAQHHECARTIHHTLRCTCDCHRLERPSTRN